MEYKSKMLSMILVASLALSLTGCSRPINDTPPNIYPSPQPGPERLRYITLDIQDELIALAEYTEIVNDYSVEATGVLTKVGNGATIDYSNNALGYVMVQCNKNTDKRLKAQVSGPTTTYTYNIIKDNWEVFPLSDGNGQYKVTVFENVTGTKYAQLTSVTFNVELRNEFEPFLRTNQYVNMKDSVKLAELSSEIVKNIDGDMQKVEAIYNWVVSNITYDRELAQTVKSGYLPKLDSIIEAKKGICFDYAALTAGMIRNQGIPCKLIVGYAGQAYHAWISVWSDTEGWIDGIIQFRADTWERMDPTFASTGKQSDKIMKYIGDGKNYTDKYIY